MEFETFEDLETGKVWALRPNEDNYLEQFLGFCPTCESAYTARYFVGL